MKNYALCPVSVSRIRVQTARLNAAFTVLLIILFGFTQSLIPLAFLCIDFLMRATVLSRFSLIGFTSRNLLRYFTVNDTMINAGPKIFAARIGFILCSLILAASLLSLSLLSFMIAGILGVFAFLESALNICVACEIYPFVYKWLYKTRFGD